MCVFRSVLPSGLPAQVSLSRRATSELRSENGTVLCSVRFSHGGRSLRSACVLLGTCLCCFSFQTESLLLYPGNLGWLVSCFDQQNMAEVMVQKFQNLRKLLSFYFAHLDAHYSCFRPLGFGVVCFGTTDH